MVFYLRHPRDTLNKNKKRGNDKNEKRSQQKITATLIVFFMFSMIFGCLEIRKADAIGANTDTNPKLCGWIFVLEPNTAVPFNNITIVPTIQSPI